MNQEVSHLVRTPPRILATPARPCLKRQRESPWQSGSILQRTMGLGLELRSISATEKEHGEGLRYTRTGGCNHQRLFPVVLNHSCVK